MLLKILPGIGEKIGHPGMAIWFTHAGYTSQRKSIPCRIAALRTPPCQEQISAPSDTSLLLPIGISSRVVLS